MKKVLICGGRNWTKKGIIKRILIQLKGEGFDTVIEGDARGADRIAGELAKEWNLNLEVYPANWELHHKAAGPIRNKQMLDEGKPELVVAFHEDIENSKGTKHMVSISRKAGIKTLVIDGK